MAPTLKPKQMRFLGRYPRGNQPGQAVQAETAAVDGRAACLRQGEDTVLLALGSAVAPATAAAEHLNTSLFDMPFIKPLDTAAVEEAAKRRATWSASKTASFKGEQATPLTPTCAKRTFRRRCCN